MKHGENIFFTYHRTLPHQNHHRSHCLCHTLVINWYINCCCNETLESCMSSQLKIYMQIFTVNSFSSNTKITTPIYNNTKINITVLRFHYVNKILKYICFIHTQGCRGVCFYSCKGESNSKDILFHYRIQFKNSLRNNTSLPEMQNEVGDRDYRGLWWWLEHVLQMTHYQKSHWDEHHWEQE